ncbi:class I SAM-dependent methyltransferase family protein [Nanoarchaeota archaeon]
MKKIRAYDIFGNIAVVKFPIEVKQSDKKKFAQKMMKINKSITTVVEKSGKFKGRLRVMQTKHLAGEKTKEALYRENACVFRFNIDKTYFSPRLSNERKEIASKIKKGDKVLVMFAGVSPFSIVIAKSSKASYVVSNEINREANKYAKLNIELNKLKNKVELLPGDIKRVVPKLKEKFDVIVMPRPQLKDSFLKQAFSVSKKNTQIFYYDFCSVKEKDLIIDKIKHEAKKSRKKIKILKIKHAGEIAPYKVRLRVDFKVL